MYSFINTYGGIDLKGCLDVDVLSQCHSICIPKKKKKKHRNIQTQINMEYFRENNVQYINKSK